MYYCILLFYCVWLLATIVNNLASEKRSRQWFAYVNFLLPRWNFFSPNPGISDMCLLRRFRLKNGEISHFEELELRADRVYSSAWIFNPKRRLSKALIDHAGMLNTGIKINELTDDNLDQIKLSFSYISLLNYCSKLPTDLPAEEVQLMIIETFGYTEFKPPQLVINSDFHKI